MADGKKKDNDKKGKEGYELDGLPLHDEHTDHNHDGGRWVMQRVTEFQHRRRRLNDPRTCFYV